MTKLACFMKQNKRERPGAEMAATASLCGEDGTPLRWQLRPLSTREEERIRAGCTREVAAGGGVTRPELDTAAYLARLVAESVVHPNLNSAELQDSYGVKTPEDLVREMVDQPGEYQELAAFVQRLNGYDVGMDRLVDEAKN